MTRTRRAMMMTNWRDLFLRPFFMDYRYAFVVFYGITDLYEGNEGDEQPEQGQGHENAFLIIESGLWTL